MQHTPSDKERKSSMRLREGHRAQRGRRRRREIRNEEKRQNRIQQFQGTVKGTTEAIARSERATNEKNTNERERKYRKG